MPSNLDKDRYYGSADDLLQGDGEAYYPTKSELQQWCDAQPHWTLMKQERCFFCKERCPQITIEFPDGTVRRKNCGTWALEFVALNPQVKVISREEA